MAITISGDTPNFSAATITTGTVTTLTATTISDGTNSTSSINVINGAKAWARFNGSTATINASYNVSSITRVSTGLYTVNFTNAFVDANYSGLVTTNESSAGSGTGIIARNTGTPTASAFQIETVNLSATRFDSTTAFCAFFR